MRSTYGGEAGGGGDGGTTLLGDDSGGEERDDSGGVEHCGKESVGSNEGESLRVWRG